MVERSSTAFDSFNARFLEPGRVGSTFVTSPHFIRVCKSENTAILGPRGSGKTTLLKMLTLPALVGWSGVAKHQRSGSVDFLAVYVPATITWNADYRTFTHRKLPTDLVDLLSMSLFRHSVLQALLTSWVDASSTVISMHRLLRKFHLPISQDDEPRLSRELARTWSLEISSSSINGLRRAIASRVRLLQKLAVTASYQSFSVSALVREHPFLTAHFLDDASALKDFLEEHYGFTRRIALCFDELEITSPIISHAVLQAPRSIDQRILIKFSAAPYVYHDEGDQSPMIPTQQNDFELIFLSSFSAKETRVFSENLFRSLCSKFSISGSAVDVLGASFLDDEAQDPDGNGSNEAPASHRAAARDKKYQHLYEFDETFVDYCHRKSIDIDDLSLGSENRRAAAVRKVLWPVLVREEFLFDPELNHSSQSARRLRSKHQISDIYTGAGAIFAICEGNPRWILGLIEPMISNAAENRGTSLPVRRSIQKEQLERMTSAYFALLSTIPNTSETFGVASLVDLVDRVGAYFQTSILGPVFNADPVMSFVVDKRVSPKLKELVGRGLNVGAFVSTPDRSSEQGYRIGEILGLKVRLADIFAPRYKLPLAGGRSINLSTLLSRPSSSKIMTLLDLFGEKI